MGRPRKNTGPDIVTEGYPYEASELDKLVSEFEDDEGAKVSLMRLLPAKDGGGAAFLRDYDPIEFNQQVVKNEFGGGKYKIHIKHGRALLKQAMFIIDGPRVRYGEEIRREYPSNESGYYRNAPGRSDRLETTTMEDKLERILATLDNPRRGDNSNDILKIVLPLLLQRQEQPRESLEDMILSRLSQYKSLFSGAGIEASTILSAVKQGMEIVANSGGEGGGGSPWLTIAEKLLPTIQNVVSMAAMNQRQPQPTPNQPPPAGPNTPTLPAEPLTGFASLAPMLAPYMPAFVTAAAQDADPGFFVEMIAPNIPPDHRTKVIEWLSGNEWLRDLSGLNPAVSAQLAWWRELKEQLLQALTGKGNGVSYGEDTTEDNPKTDA